MQIRVGIRIVWQGQNGGGDGLLRISLASVRAAHVLRDQRLVT